METYYDRETDQDKQRRVLDRPSPGCQVCGIHFRRHQRIGALWLFYRGLGLLADSVGTGKTVSLLALVALMKQNHELDDGERVLICCRSAAISQWHRQAERMIPAIRTITATGTRQQRVAAYTSSWDVVLIGPQMLLRDEALLMNNFRFAALVTDDVDPLRNRDTSTSYVLKRIARGANRVVVATGTPLQKRLTEMYSILEPVGGLEAFGSEAQFKMRYVQSERVESYNTKTGKAWSTEKVTGYKNMNDFVAKLNPFALRRTALDIDDVHLPEIISSDEMLELYPRQRQKYNELRKGVLEIVKSSGTQIKHLQAMTKLLYGAKICGGMATLGEEDGPQASSKLDWVIDKLSDGGDLEEEKVVVFAAFKDTLRALQARLTARGISWEVIWGEDRDKDHRDASQQRFWNDPRCRVLMGTQSIEQSLNLQIARHLINIDMILNPARMEQLAGRIRRDGSMFRHVFVHNLLVTGTQEERYIPALEREQAVIDRVWDERSELFNALDPLSLMSLITG